MDQIRKLSGGAGSVFMTYDNVLQVSYKKKIWKKILFCILKVTEERSHIRIRQSEIRISTKMSRITDTG
jgi:hypothetical protein